MDLRYNPRFEICIETDLLRRFVDLTLCASEYVLLCVSLQLGGVRHVGEAPHQVWHEADREYRAQLRIKLFPLRLRKLPRKVRVLPTPTTRNIAREAGNSSVSDSGSVRFASSGLSAAPIAW